jgi:hypothetical protein
MFYFYATILSKISEKMAHNVSAIYDVFAPLKSICESKCAAQKCVRSERGNGAKRNDLANEASSPLPRARHISSC